MCAIVCVCKRSYPPSFPKGLTCNSGPFSEMKRRLVLTHVCMSEVCVCVVQIPFIVEF